MVTINVYMKDGRTFSYDVENVAKAREHAYRIVTECFRNNENGIMEYYPPERVFKVAFAMPERDMMAIKYKAEAK